MLEHGYCISNSVQTLTECPELRYAEGLALSSHGLWYRHAWNVGEDGRVIDRTWTGGQRYIGRIWDRDAVLDAAVTRKVYDYMDEAAHPLVPDGGAGLDCYTAEQAAWVMQQLRSSRSHIIL
jgi:hypothetical protein